MIGETSHDGSIIGAVVRPAVGWTMDQSVRSAKTRSGESLIPYLCWALVPPPSGTLPPLKIACPPIS